MKANHIPAKTEVRIIEEGNTILTLTPMEAIILRALCNNIQYNEAYRIITKEVNTTFSVIEMFLDTMCNELGEN